MAKELNKTEQGKQERLDEKSARSEAAQVRRNSAAKKQFSSEQRAGPSFAQREAAAGLTNTTAGRDDFYYKNNRTKQPWASLDGSEMKAGSPMEFGTQTVSSDIVGGGGGGGGGGIPDGYQTIVLDYVSASNSAASGTFLIET